MGLSKNLWHLKVSVRHRDDTVPFTMTVQRESSEAKYRTDRTETSDGRQDGGNRNNNHRMNRFSKFMQSEYTQYAIAFAMMASIVLLIVIPWAVTGDASAPSTDILVIGDSQCENMEQYFADTLFKELSMNLKMRGLLQKGGVRMKLDCRSWRRLAECLPTHKHCSSAKAILPKYCKDKNYDIVVPWVGVNNIDWNSTMYGTTGEHYFERRDRTIQEVNEVFTTATTFCPNSRVLAVAPLNIANCGWGWGHLGDTCQGFDGSYAHPFFISHWLGQQIKNVADVLPRVTFYNTSGLEDTSKYYDATHTRDPVVAKNIAMGLSNAIATQVHAQQLSFEYSMNWENALSQSTVMFTDKEIKSFSDDPANGLAVSGLGRLDYKKPRLVDAFHEPAWDVLCGNNTLNETLGGGTGVTANSTGDSDSEAACGKIELKEFWAIVAILLAPLILFEALSYAILCLDDSNEDKKTTTQANVKDPNSKAIATTTTSSAQSPVVQSESPHKRVLMPCDPLPRMMPALEGVRVLGAFHILVFHLYQKFEWTHYNAETCQFCGFGKYWVQVFFVLTGFVSYKSCSRETSSPGHSDGWTLARRRVVVLYPLYFISSLMGYLTTILNGAAASSDEVFRTLLLNQTWWPPFHFAGVNGPGWFLSCLLCFWVALPHWCRSMKKAASVSLGEWSIDSVANSSSATGAQNSRSLSSPGHASPGADNNGGNSSHSNVSRTNSTVSSSRSSMPPLLLLCLFSVSYLASWGSHLSCYQILDFPLKGRWYAMAVHNLVEFSPYANWYHVAFGASAACLIEYWPRQSLLKRVIRFCGASLAVLGTLVFFLLARSPGFSMGTHELLIDKGPFALPVLFVLLVACSDKDLPDPMASKILTTLGKLFASLSWPIYILHVPISSLLKQILEEEEYPIVFYVLVQPMVLVLAACLGAKFHSNWNRFFSSKKKKSSADVVKSKSKQTSSNSNNSGSSSDRGNNGKLVIAMNELKPLATQDQNVDKTKLVEVVEMKKVSGDGDDQSGVERLSRAKSDGSDIIDDQTKELLGSPASRSTLRSDKQ